jgi:nitric oxide reductase activation protein
VQRLEVVLRQQQASKWIVIITDGRPTNLPLTQLAVRKAIEQGVKVVGIGIGKSGLSIRDYLPDSPCVKSLGELQYALRNLLKSLVKA